MYIHVAKTRDRSRWGSALFGIAAKPIIAILVRELSPTPGALQRSVRSGSSAEAFFSSERPSCCGSGRVCSRDSRRNVCEQEAFSAALVSHCRPHGDARLCGNGASYEAESEEKEI